MTLDRWLTRLPSPAEYDFVVRRLSENCPPDDDIIGFLSYEILIAHVKPRVLKDDCESLLQDAQDLRLDIIEQYLQEEFNILEKEWDEIEEAVLDGYLIKEVFPNPTRLSTRIGNFGEVLAAKHLVLTENFWFPIYKLRLRDKKDWASRLTDLCLLKTDGLDRPLVCYAEVKTHSSRCDKNLGISGHDSLIKDDALDNPEILRYLKALFGEMDEHEKARFFWNLKTGRTQCDKRHELHIIHDVDTWHEDILNNLNEHELDDHIVNFSVKVFLIYGLRYLIDTVYEHSWKSAKEIVDG
jgi:hypothetical protein